MMPSLAAASHPRSTYDHRLRQQVCRTGVRFFGHRIHIPRSTITSWKRRGVAPVITLAPFSQEQQDLVARVDKLEQRVRILAAVVHLLLALLRAAGFRLDQERLPEGAAKSRILAAVASAEKALPLASILRVLHLSQSRYHAWRRAADGCGLDDRSSCPRTSPGQLTAAEVATVKEMVLAPEHRHMPLSTLGRYAQRIGKVFASPTTWAKLVRDRGWRRPRQRVHPPKPTVGVRAERPNQIWHIDVSILKLLDGTKAYIHAVIDNYSRKILAWTVETRLDPMVTCSVLIAAGKHLVSAARPTVVADSGVENVNGAVDATLLNACLQRVLAQVEVSYSNSMIEAFWRSLKHQWLYLNSLDSTERVRSLVVFFVEAHNTQMPHSAFDGQTPDEVYFGTAANLPAELAASHAAARAARLAFNRSLSCGRCAEPQDAATAIPVIPRMAQLRTRDCQRSWFAAGRAAPPTRPCRAADVPPPQRLRRSRRFHHDLRPVALANIFLQNVRAASRGSDSMNWCPKTYRRDQGPSAGTSFPRSIHLKARTLSTGVPMP